MKNKKSTYLLAFIVMIVWGMIIYRIFDAAGGNDDLLTIVTKPVKEVYHDFAVQKDTTRLLLNYRDPFGLAKSKDTIEPTIKHTKVVIESKSMPAINWSFIQYSGYIRNPTSKKLISLLTISGKNEMLSEGETKDQVKLIKNMRDSIKVSYFGKTKFIVIKSAML